MRVLHVTAYYAPAFVYGGPPRSIHGLCRALLARGLGIEVFTTDANGGVRLPAHVTNAADYEGVPVRYFPRTWPADPIGSRPLAAALRRALADVDLVHVHGLWNRVVWNAAREARRAGVPYVLSPRGMLEQGALAHHALRKRVAWAVVERATVDGAATLHATSDSELQTLRARRPGADVVLVPNGVELPGRAAPAERRAVVAFIGRLHPTKRLDLLVDAFAQLRASGRRARLVIGGPDESGLRESLARRAPAVSHEIIWLGPIDAGRRQALLAEATALVLCSDSESFGLSVAEAMAAGVPVVVTRTCPWSEVERHGAGYWVDQRAEAIAEALGRLLDDPAAARAMGERGRALVERKYRWEAVARELERHYARIAALHAAAPAPAVVE